MSLISYISIGISLILLMVVSFLILRRAQSTALQHWDRHRYSLTLKARQIGWTTLVAAHQFWLAFFYPDQNIIDLSRTERESVLLLKKSKYGFQHLPEWMVGTWS